MKISPFGVIGELSEAEVDLLDQYADRLDKLHTDVFRSTLWGFAGGIVLASIIGYAMTKAK